MLIIYRAIIDKVLSLKTFPRLHLFKVLHSVIVSSLTPKFTLVQGNTMFLDSIDSLGLSKYGIYEPYTTELLKQFIQKGDIVLDIGANIGYYSLIFSRLVGKGGKVYAFEPDSVNFSLLKKNIETNEMTNVIAEQKAVTDKTGKTRLFLSLIHKGMHRIAPHKDLKSIEIDTIRLDDFFCDKDKKVNFIKIDIEGAEPAAFNGMHKVLETNKNIKIITEFNPVVLTDSGFCAQELLDLLVKLGFKFYCIDEENKKIEAVEVLNFLEKHDFQNGFSTNLLCLRGEELGTSILDKIRR